MGQWISTRNLLIAAGVCATVGVLATGATGVRLTQRYVGRLLAHNTALLSQRDAATHDSVWVIVNPAKHKNLRAFQERITAAAQTFGVPHIHWLETKPEDPGVGQAIEAQRQGATLVIAAGGDGTVRAVAAGMAHSNVRMGIIPVGTGNIFARNLNLPIGDLERCVAIALGRNYRNVDLGWLRSTGHVHSLGLPAEGRLVNEARTSGADTAPSSEIAGYSPLSQVLPADDEYSYVVVSGVGFDGQTMAGTDAQLKKKIGWLAYIVSGVQALNVPRMNAHVRLWDKGNDTPTEDGEVTAKSIMFANVGQLPFMTLAPNASMDDEKLDVIGVDVIVGLIGWMSLGWKFFVQGLGVPAIDLPASPGRLAFRQACRAEVTVEQPATVEVDGDAIAIADGVATRIDPGALQISAPDITTPW